MSNNNFDEEFINSLHDGVKKLVIVEGGIGAGKSTSLKLFSPKHYIHVPEPLDEMKSILELFYAGKLDERQTAYRIEDICMQKMHDAMLIAGGKSVVIERTPWLRKFVFRYPPHFTAAGVAEVKHAIVNGTKRKPSGAPISEVLFKEVCREITERTGAYPTAEAIMKDYALTPSLWGGLPPQHGEKPFEIFQVIVIDTPIDITEERVAERGREFESNVTAGYLELIKMRTLRITQKHLYAGLSLGVEKIHECIDHFEYVSKK